MPAEYCYGPYEDFVTHLQVDWYQCSAVLTLEEGSVPKCRIGVNRSNLGNGGSEWSMRFAQIGNVVGHETVQSRNLSRMFRTLASILTTKLIIVQSYNSFNNLPSPLLVYSPSRGSVLLHVFRQQLAAS